MSRTRVRRRRRLVAAVMGVLVAGVLTAPLATALGETKGHTLDSGQRYVVQSGDTLWSIARFVAPGEDPRSVVDALIQANGVDPGALVPGRSLVVPPAG